MTEPIPDWVANTPSTSAIHPTGTEQTAFTRPEFLNSLPNFIQYLIENILGVIVKAIFGVFIPGDLGSAFTQLSSWAANVPFIGGTISSAINFITGFLDPAKLLFSQGMVQNPARADWPKTFPGDFGELIANPIQLLVQNLSRMLTGSSTGGNLISTAFSLPTSILHFVTNILLPSGRVASRDATTGLLPDAEKPQAVQDMIDSADNVFQGLPIIGSIVGGPVEAFFNALKGIHSTGQNAVDVNVQQNALINKLQTDGNGIIETFDGTAVDGLPNFTSRDLGTGGSNAIDGKGNAVWDPSGGSSGGAINRHNTALDTDTQLISLVINSNIANASSPSHEELVGRCNLAADTYVTGKVFQHDCEIGYVIADVYTDLGSADHDGAAGSWDLKLGTTADDYEFILYRNNSEVLRVSDSSAASQMGADYRFPGFVQAAGTNFFWVFLQVGVPDNAAFGASDRTADS